jgi:hypothetical protein
MDTESLLKSLNARDDLIRMKQAAGRPKDIEDLRVLTKLKQEHEDSI